MSESREERRERLVEVYREASVCTKCPLSETRTNVVFGTGNADADLMFVGEAPGAEEDRQGLPFVGRAGGLLTELLEGIGLTREEVFITNVLRCRPPGNRDPQPVEIESCQPYLYRQVELIEPRVIATLGNFATKLLTGSRVGITRVRGTPQVREIGGRTVFLMPLLHPAAALRTPSLVDTLREDFAKLPELLDGPLPEDAAAPRCRARRRLAAAPAEPRGRSARPVRRLTTERSSSPGRDGGDRRRGWPPALRPGDVVLVGGELGAGKTTLIRGACRELGVDEPVVSPTFTIGRRYRGRVPVSHLDLYRLEGLGGEDPGLLDDYLTPTRSPSSSGRRRPSRCSANGESPGASSCATPAATA